MKVILCLCGILLASQLAAGLGTFQYDLVNNVNNKLLGGDVDISGSGETAFKSCVQSDVDESCAKSRKIVLEQEKNETLFLAAGVDVPFKKSRGALHSHASFSHAFDRSHVNRWEGTKYSVAGKALCEKLQLTTPSARRSFLAKISISDRFNADLACKFSCNPGNCTSSQLKFRTPNGFCNNLKNPRNGQAGTPFARFLAPLYDDGVSSPRNTSVAGTFLPSPRLISQRVHTNVSSEVTKLTHLVMQWGQWTDHDVDATPMFFGEDGSEINCCERDFTQRLNVTALQILGVPEQVIAELVGLRDGCFPIFHARDPVFNNNTCMNFIRSLPATPSKCKLSWREQQNGITSFIDSSNIYGSSEEVQSFSTNSETLRTGTGGLLLVAPNRAEELLPLDTEGEGSCIVDFVNGPDELCFRAGDGRSNEFVSLASFHTMWLREHNRVARILGDEHPDWDDERIFQEARRIIAAFNQHITYNEWLPILLGDDLVDKFELRPLETGFFTGYNFKTVANIRNSFATAAFRVGHSFINSQLSRVSEDFQPIGESPLSTGGSFFRPSPLFDTNLDGPDSILRGMASDPVQNFDRFITEQVTERLFEDRFESPSQPALDLAALNIQRGRDHGLPPYLAFRKLCEPFPSTVNSFFDLRFTHSFVNRRALQSAYSNVKDIDLFAGAMSENIVEGALVGQTFGCLIAAQFSSLKFGDRFYYENKPSSIAQTQGFSAAELAQIRKVTLAGILCNNVGANVMQPQAFKTPIVTGNARIPCSQIPQPNITVFNSENAFTGTDLPAYV